MTDEQLRTMAETAFDVLNWSRRLGMKKPQQIEQVVEGFKVDLRTKEFKLLSAAASRAMKGKPDG